MRSWTYDARVDAFYVLLADAPVSGQRASDDGRIIVDVDAEGEVVGVEVLGASTLEAGHAGALTEEGWMALQAAVQNRVMFAGIPSVRIVRDPDQNADHTDSDETDDGAGFRLAEPADDAPRYQLAI